MGDALVIGGGIAGLAAGVGLRQAGYNVRILEQSAQLRTEGAGLQITPNGMRALDVLGCRGALINASLPAQTLSPGDGLSGQALMKIALPTGSYRTVFRSKLMQVLAERAVSLGVTIQTNAKVAEIDARQSVVCADGTAFAADVIVAADGGLSKIRAHFNTEQATFSGQIAWRAVVERQTDDNGVRLWMAPKQHVVTYPLDETSLNIVAIEEADHWQDEGWHILGDVSAFCERFAALAPAVRAPLERASIVMKWALVLRPVAEHWVDRNVVLVGDAAHPTLPFLAQGANLALEDAAVLSLVCEQRDLPVEDRLQRFQTLRLARAKKVVAGANANAKNYHLNGMRRHIAQLGLKTIGQTAPNLFLRRYDWIYEYDVTQAIK